MLYLRILSALIGIPIVLGAVYLGGPWYGVLLLLVVNLGTFEYGTLLKIRGYKIPLVFCFPAVSLILTAIYFNRSDYIYPLLMVSFFIFFMHAILTMERESITEAALALWGIIYLGGLAGYMLLLRMLPEGALYTFMLLIGVWVHDSAAYFVGVKWGIRKFAPLISPNKSVEGSVAGILSSVALFFSAAILLPELVPFNPGQALSFGLGIAVFAQLGDLFESSLKRQLEVKDSGNLIPGHGGILDRFDSLLLTAPFVYYFFTLLLHL